MDGSQTDGEADSQDIRGNQKPSGEIDACTATQNIFVILGLEMTDESRYMFLMHLFIYLNSLKRAYYPKPYVRERLQCL